MYSGHAAVDYLARHADTDDSGASSHWKKYHSRFRFTGDGFEGLRGFGGCQPPPAGLRRSLHALLQRRFRRIGAQYPQFGSIDTLATSMTARQQRAYDLDVLRQSLTLAYLRASLPAAMLSPTATVCVIGDGFASMTALLLASGSAGRVVLVNLTRTLLVDLWYLRLWMGSEEFGSSVHLVTCEDEIHSSMRQPLAAAPSGPSVIAIQAHHHELLRRLPLDLSLNIVSMQEMDPSVISAYFDDLRTVAGRRSLVFYCCNREEKTLPDGTVTRIAEYPWQPEDRVLVDQLCPWHQQYYALIPPFYRPYDGPIRHRLIEMAGPAQTVQRTYDS